MGAIKVALGDAGRDLTSLAAADYFFRNRYRRAYFKHFTNLVPMERSGSIRKSMDTAESVLRRGRSMVVFPEGTRSVTGRAWPSSCPASATWRCGPRSGVLPAHVGGQLRGAAQGNGGAARARADGVVRAFSCPRVAGGADRRAVRQQEAWRLVAAFTQRVVENLRDGVATALDVEAARAAWDGQRARPGGGARAAAPARAEVGAMKKEARPTTW